MTRVNRYPCPRLEQCHIKYGIETLRGWKHHMTRAHGGFTSDELAVAEGQASGRSQETSEESFRKFAEAMPESARPTVPSEGTVTGAEGARPSGRAPGEPVLVAGEGEVRKRLTREQREVNEKVNKFATLLLRRTIKSLNDVEQEEFQKLRDEVLVLALGIQLDLSEGGYVLRSRLWLLLALALAEVVPEGAFGKAREAIKQAREKKKEHD